MNECLVYWCLQTKIVNVIANYLDSMIFDAEHRYDEVVFDHREEAEEVLDLMIDISTLMGAVVLPICMI